METSVNSREISRASVGFVPKATDMRATEFKERINAVFAFVAPNAHVKASIPKVAKFLGLGERRVRAIHACEARSLGLADDEALFEAEVKIAEHALTEGMQLYADRLEYAALKYAAKSPDANRDRIARWRDLARRVRRVFDREAA